MVELRDHAGPELQMYDSKRIVIKPLEVVNVYYDYKTIDYNPLS